MALRVDDVDLVRDRALVERFQAGDLAAFDTLYQRYFARLVRFCQKRIGDPLEAEEVAQEAFARALRALPHFGGDRRFYPWVTVIASRLCVDTHRRRGRSEPCADIDLGSVEASQDHLVDRHDVHLLGAALGRLAPRHRDVLALREQQEWSYQQIAQHYGVTVGTVEALLFRARKALRREYLAVVGGERTWVAAPLAGVLARPLAALRARLDALSSALSPAVAPAVTVAVAVMTVVISVGAARLGPAPAPAPDTSLRLETASRPAPAPPASEKVALPVVSEAHAHPPAGQASPAEPAGQRPLAIVPVEISGAEEAHRKGAESPHAVGADGVATVYIIDPPEAAAGAMANAAALLGQGGNEK